MRIVFELPAPPGTRYADATPLLRVPVRNRRGVRIGTIVDAKVTHDGTVVEATARLNRRGRGFTSRTDIRIGAAVDLEVDD